MSDIESDKGSVKWEASPQTPPPQQQQSTQADQQPQITTAAAAASLSPRSSLDLFKRLNLDRFMENNLKLARANYHQQNNNQISEPLNDKAKRARLVDGEEEEESMESRSSSWSSLDNSCESDTSSSSSTTPLDSTVINSKSKEISSREFGLIDVWLNAFYTSRELVSLDFNIQPRLLSLLEFKADADFPANIRKTCKAMLANFLLKPIMRIVHFVKMLPDFGDLDPEDQMSLLNGGSMEMFICSATSLYDQISNKLLNLVSREAKTTRSQSLPATSPTAPSNPSLALIQMDILKMIWNEDLFEKTIGFMKSMNELKIDETTLVLLLPIILFSPERTDLKNRQLVYKIQSSYSLLLEKYICWKYSASNDHQCKSEPMQLYNRLLLILIELRSLQEMHSMFLMDVDPSNMEYGSSS